MLLKNNTYSILFLATWKEKQYKNVIEEVFF